MMLGCYTLMHSSAIQGTEFTRTLKTLLILQAYEVLLIATDVDAAGEWAEAVLEGSSFPAGSRYSMAGMVKFRSPSPEFVMVPILCSPPPECLEPGGPLPSEHPEAAELLEALRAVLAELASSGRSASNGTTDTVMLSNRRFIFPSPPGDIHLP